MLADELTATQIADWWHYYQCEPWGGFRDDCRLAAFSQRFAGGEKADDVRAIWPYWPPKESPAEVLVKLRQLKRKALEKRNGT
jgi:hypothetical protein